MMKQVRFVIQSGNMKFDQYIKIIYFSIEISSCKLFHNYSLEVFFFLVVCLMDLYVETNISNRFLKNRLLYCNFFTRFVCEDFPELKYAVENSILKDFDGSE